MKIGVLKETSAHESRVALVPAHIPALLKRDFSVLVEKGAGYAAGYEDAQYLEKGASLHSVKEILQQADIICVVRGAAARDDGEALSRQKPTTRLMNY